MNHQEKVELLNQYVKAPQEILSLINGLDDKIIFFKKDKDYWSIQENIIHLLDGDINSYVRYRKAIAEPKTSISAYDEIKWTETLLYDKHDRNKALSIMTLIRELIFEHLLHIINKDWTKYQYLHPDSGLINLEEWIKLMIAHADIHKKYIERNIRAAQSL